MWALREQLAFCANEDIFWNGWTEAKQRMRDRNTEVGWRCELIGAAIDNLLEPETPEETKRSGVVDGGLAAASPSQPITSALRRMRYAWQHLWLPAAWPPTRARHEHLAYCLLLAVYEEEHFGRDIAAAKSLVEARARECAPQLASAITEAGHHFFRALRTDTKAHAIFEANGLGVENR